MVSEAQRSDERRKKGQADECRLARKEKPQPPSACHLFSTVSRLRSAHLYFVFPCPSIGL